MAYPPMHDQSTMPFGAHKGKKLIEVPASWLLWYLSKGSPGTLLDYCQAAEPALLKELEYDKQKVRVKKPAQDFNADPSREDARGGFEPNWDEPTPHEQHAQQHGYKTMSGNEPLPPIREEDIPF